MKTAEATILRGEDAILTPLREALQDFAADEVDIHVHRRRAAVTRYSHSSIHQNALSDETHVRVRAIVGKAVGVATTNSLEVADLRRALGDAASLARASRPDDEWPGVAEPAPIATPQAYDDATALAPAGVAARAIAKCGLDRDRRQLPPGDYEAVFVELAVAEILRIVSLTGLGGQSVREGRSFMSDRIGEQVTGDRLTLSDDALDPRTLAIPFDDEGQPKQRGVRIQRGVA